MKVAAVILAAGSSRRLGQPKQDLRLGGETLLDRTVRLANLARLDPVYVVLAAGSASRLDGRATVLLNHEAAEGMAASIRIGILAAQAAGAAGVVILACDQPAVTAQHLRAIALGGEEIIASEYAGGKGVPGYFPATAFAALLQLRGDAGARAMLRSARAISLVNGELDIDTEEDLARARELYDGRDVEDTAQSVFPNV